MTRMKVVNIGRHSAVMRSSSVTTTILCIALLLSLLLTDKTVSGNAPSTTTTTTTTAAASSKTVYKYPTAYYQPNPEYAAKIIEMQKLRVEQVVSHKVPIPLFKFDTSAYHNLFPSHAEHPRTINSTRFRSNIYHNLHFATMNSNGGNPVDEEQLSIPLRINRQQHQQRKDVHGTDIPGTGNGQSTAWRISPLSSQVVNVFDVEYSISVPQNVRNIVNRATEIWSTFLIGVNVPITMKVNWVSESGNVLASAGPSFVYYYTPKGMYYPPSVLSQMIGDPVSSDPDYKDIVVNMNGQFYAWHYDIEQPPPSGKYDMLSTALHEIAHGLGFVGFISTASSYPLNSYYVFDRYVYTSAGVPVVSPGKNMYQTLKDKKLNFWTSNNHQSGFVSENNPILYNPTTFAHGSSVYHLDETIYSSLPNGGGDALMTPMLNSAERILQVGNPSLNILETLGWEVRNCSDYNSNCKTCTSASCFWCSNGDDQNFCTSSMTKNAVCQMNSDFFAHPGDCPHCLSDSDCDDPQDACNFGTCDLSTGECSYEQLNCLDGDYCNADYCDSSIGCVHHYSIYSCNPQFCGTQDCALCIHSEERVHITSPVVVRVGVDIPSIPAGFFGSGSAPIHDLPIQFTWCKEDVNYATIQKHATVNVNTSSGAGWQIVDAHTSYFHMCAINTIPVTYTNGKASQIWTGEIYISGNSNLNAYQKSNGYMSFKFTSCKTISQARIDMDILLGFSFYHGKTKRVLDFDEPSGFNMPFVTIISNEYTTSQLIGHNNVNLYTIESS